MGGRHVWTSMAKMFSNKSAWKQGGCTCSFNIKSFVSVFWKTKIHKSLRKMSRHGCRTLVCAVLGTVGRGEGGGQGQRSLVRAWGWVLLAMKSKYQGGKCKIKPENRGWGPQGRAVGDGEGRCGRQAIGTVGGTRALLVSVTGWVRAGRRHIFERSQQARQGQSAGCSGQDLFTSNQESMQLLW